MGSNSGARMGLYKEGLIHSNFVKVQAFWIKKTNHDFIRYIRERPKVENIEQNRDKLLELNLDFDATIDHFDFVPQFNNSYDNKKLCKPIKNAYDLKHIPQVRLHAEAFAQ